MKKRPVLIALLAAALIFVPAQSFAAGGFTDVREGYWAVPYIELAKQTGLIEGYTAADGTAEFRPENYVTKQECLVMLYNTLKLAGSLETEEDLSSGFGDFYSCHETPPEGGAAGIPQWARIYVSYSLENGICEEEDFSTGADENGRSGGFSYASRQLIARWTAKMLGCDKAAFYELVYADSDKAEPENLVFLDALKRLGIMQGNNGSFNPASGVKRSEMAAICLRLLGVRADEENGIITDRGAITENGAAAEGFELYDSETFLSGLGLEDRVLMYAGVLTEVDLTKRIIRLEGADRLYSFRAEPDTEFVIDGKNVTFDSLSDHIGASLTVSWHLYGETSVVLQTGPIVQDGYIRSISDYDGYSIVTVSTDTGVYIDLCITEQSSVKGELKKNRSCRFISDGIKVLEMR